MESSEERKRRLKRQRQMRWRNRRRLGTEYAEPGTSLVPAAVPDEPGTADGLPRHAYSPAFGAMLGIAAMSLTEAHRYTELVQGMDPVAAITPLRPGSSPPASEARLQRAEARQALSALAATPSTAVRVMKDISSTLDLAAEAAAIREGRSKRFPGAYMADDGQFVIPGDGDDGDGDAG